MNKQKIRKKLTDIIALVSECIVLLGGAEEEVDEVATSAQDQGLRESEGDGKVLAKPGHRCYCTLCKKDIFEVVTPIYGRNMGIDKFLGAFKSLTDKNMTRSVLEAVFKDKNGNVFVDCPVCKGETTLQLIGEAVRIDAKIDASPDVTSVNPDELAL